MHEFTRRSSQDAKHADAGRKFDYRGCHDIEYFNDMILQPNGCDIVYDGNVIQMTTQPSRTQLIVTPIDTTHMACVRGQSVTEH